MKTFLLFLLLICVSCSTNAITGKQNNQNENFEISNNKFQEKFGYNFKTIDVPENILINTPASKNLYAEIIKLFDPNEFDCGCTKKLKKSILKNSN